MPSPVGGLWACPRKNQFCAKNYAILSKFWYFFPILQHKNGIRRRESGGDYPLSPKSGDLSPCPPCSDAYECLPLLEFCDPLSLTSSQCCCIIMFKSFRKNRNSCDRGTCVGAVRICDGIFFVFQPD